MTEPQIQFPPLTLTEVNMLLDALKPMPFGQVYELFTKLHAEAQKQLQAQTLPPESPPSA